VRQLRAELLKVRTTRTTLGLLLGLVALVLLFTLLGGLLTHAENLVTSDDQYQVLGTGTAAILFGSLVGVMLVTTEYRYGTIRPGLLFEPRRPRYLAAKLGAGLIGGAVFGAIAIALSLGIGLIILSARGIPRAMDGGELTRLAVGTVVVAALWSAIGVGVGALVRHQVGAIIGVLAWVLVIENVIFGLVPSVGRFLPGPTGQALAGDTQDHLLSSAAGGVLFVAWALAFAVLGTLAAVRRDVD
jgi:hypothetical protein